ncbi:MAG: transcription antitermination factor NusB [Proteobacteria bacterium]|nr:transcription antitermination factor NusB [Pseudomonadota bacterium]
MGVRRQAREAALQAIYMSDFSDNWNVQDCKLVFENFQTPASAINFASELYAGVSLNVKEIDADITAVSANWSLPRMSSVDRNLLRLAAFELKYNTETPVNVIINEAIEIAKDFGSNDSPQFINGILDRVALKVRPGSKKSESAIEVIRETPVDDFAVPEEENQQISIKRD